MKRIFLEIISILLFWTWVAEAQIPVFTEKYSVLSGLSQDAILDIKKDESGFIWFASRDGLSRFDGNSFMNFKANSNVPQILESQLLITDGVVRHMVVAK